MPITLDVRNVEERRWIPAVLCLRHIEQVIRVTPIRMTGGHRPLSECSFCNYLKSEVKSKIMEIDDETLTAVQRYADFFGRSADDVAIEALADWLQTVGAARVEIARERELQSA